MSQQLDRGKSLWEMWVVEGLEGDRFAIVTKAHHCMIDGVGSVELTGSVMRQTPDDDPRLAEPPPRMVPAPRPIAGAPLRRRALPPRDGAARCAPDSGRGRDGAASRSPRVSAMRRTGSSRRSRSGLRPASATPLNVPIGPHRRFDWTRTDLGLVRAAKGRFGGTVNDVALAELSGALRRFLHRRGVDVDNLDFGAMLPVNVRTSADRLGNRVAMMAVRLRSPSAIRTLASPGSSTRRRSSGRVRSSRH
jgi:diacylglycerol O-acyltransferase